MILFEGMGVVLDFFSRYGVMWGRMEWYPGGRGKYLSV